ncbi:MAG TPA: tetratricopeptide repeat protein [Verrucomicrobiota bacterium]|nr:tetratricopeptide repeat protein [Verrucomicrobiota bacterium]
MLLLLTVFAVRGFASTDTVSTFDMANKLYEQSRFTEAAGMYEHLIQSGTVSSALYFNLGNALFKAGQSGRAIAAYRQAQALSPRDADLRANLQFARDKVQGPTYRGSAWELWLAKLSVNEWTVAAAVAIWITFLLLAVRQLRPSAARALRGWTIFSGAVAILLCGLLGCAFAHRQSVTVAVVTRSDATVRTGPFDESPGVFTANDGAELRVLDTKDGWLQVTAGQRRVGWIKNDSVTLLDRSG